LVAATKDGDIR